MVMFFEQIIYKNRPYIYAGFGVITKRKYPIKLDKLGRYILFNMKKEYL
jgi:hypothetical protein